MANTTNSSQQSSRSDREPSQVQESASSRPRPPTAPLASTTTVAEAAVRKLRKNARASSPVKNTNGKRPLDDEERMMPEGATASKHVFGNNKPAIKSKVAPAPSKIPSAASKAPAASTAASKATAGAKIAPTKTPLAVIKAAGATKAAATKATAVSKAPAVKKEVPAATTVKPRAKAPAPGSRFQLTAKENTIRPVKRTPEQLARENKELQEKFAAADEKAKNFKVHPDLLEGGKKSANTSQTTKTGASKSEGATKAKAPAEKTTNTNKAAQSAAKSNANTAKALAEKTNTSTKRRSTDADLDDVPSPQKKRRFEGSQPARIADKKSEHDENAPPAAKARPTHATSATEKAEEKVVAAPKPARKPNREVQRVFWSEDEDGEESELELVTKEECLGKGGKKVESKEKTEVKAGTEPTAKETVAKKISTKRASNDSDEEAFSLALKKAKVAEPQVNGATDDAKTTAPLAGDNTSVATRDSESPPLEPVVPRKKGVAHFTDPKVRKQHAAQAKRRADDIAWRKEQAAEREAAMKAGHTVAKATDFFTI